MGIQRGREPWVETHGYHHEVAPRLLESGDVVRNGWLVFEKYIGLPAAM